MTIMASDTPTLVQIFLKSLGISLSRNTSNPFTKLATFVSRSNKIGKAFVVRSAWTAVSCSIKIQTLAVLAEHVETCDFTRIAKKGRRSEESKRSLKSAAPKCRDQEAELLHVGTNQLEPGNEY